MRVRLILDIKWATSNWCRLRMLVWRWQERFMTWNCFPIKSRCKLLLLLLSTKNILIRILISCPEVLRMMVKIISLLILEETLWVVIIWLIVRVILILLSKTQPRKTSTIGKGWYLSLFSTVWCHVITQSLLFPLVLAVCALYLLINLRFCLDIFIGRVILFLARSTLKHILPLLSNPHLLCWVTMPWLVSILQVHILLTLRISVLPLEIKILCWISLVFTPIDVIILKWHSLFTESFSLCWFPYTQIVKLRLWCLLWLSEDGLLLIGFPSFHDHWAFFYEILLFLRLLGGFEVFPIC